MTYSLSLKELARIIEWFDAYLDEQVSQAYKDQPLAQDIARVAKLTEEAGEAVDAFIGLTGQNPRKGVYHTEEDLLAELADVAATAIYGIQHFTKDRHRTIETLLRRIAYHRLRAAPKPSTSGDTRPGPGPCI